MTICPGCKNEINRQGLNFCPCCGASLSSHQEYADESGESLPPKPGTIDEGGESLPPEPVATDKGRETVIPPPGAHTDDSIPSQPVKKHRWHTLIWLLPALLIICGVVIFVNAYTARATATVDEKLDLAVKYLSENKFEEAILAYQQAIEIDKREVRAYQGLAKVYTLQGDFEQAEKTYDQGIKAVEEDGNILKLRLGLAGMYIDKGSPEETEKLYKEIINKNKDCTEAYRHLALLYEQNGESKKALGVLEEAKEVNSEDYRVYNALSYYYMCSGEQGTGDTDSVLQALIQSLALEINQGEAYFIFKNIYGGDWADFLDKSSDLSDEKVAKVVAMLRFYALFEQGNYEEALDIYEKQLAIDKDNQKAKVLAAICLLETGEKKKAAKLAEELGKSDPNSWIMADLALYYLKAGDQEKALQLAEKSLDSDLTNLDAVAVLSELAKSGIELQCNLAIIKFVVYSTEPIRLAEQELKAMSLDIPLEYQLPSSPWKLSDRSKDIPEQDESDDTSGDKGDTPVVVDQQKNKAVEAQDPDTIEAVFAAVQSYLDKYYGLSVVNGDIYDPSYNGYAIRIHEISDLKGNRAVGLLGPYASEADYEIGVHKRGGRWQVDYCCSYYMGVDCDSDKSENYEEICSLIAKKEGFEIKDDAWVYRFDLKSYDSGRAVVLAAPFCEHWKWVYTLEKGSSGWQVVSREPASEPRFPEWLYGHARR